MRDGIPASRQAAISELFFSCKFGGLSGVHTLGVIFHYLSTHNSGSWLNFKVPGEQFAIGHCLAICPSSSVGTVKDIWYWSFQRRYRVASLLFCFIDCYEAF